MWGLQAQGKIKALTQQVADLEADLKRASSDKADMLRLAQRSTMMQVGLALACTQHTQASNSIGWSLPQGIIVSHKGCIKTWDLS